MRPQHRADVGARVQPVAQLKTAHKFGQLFRETAVQALGHINSFRTGAHLPGVDQSGVGGCLDGQLHFYIRSHYQRVFAAQLQVQLFHHWRGNTGDALPGGHGAGEGNQRHIGMAHQGFARSACACYHIHHAGREVVKGQFHQLERRKGRVFGRFDNGRIARSQRRSQFPG